jgi:hypothetical protein
MEENVVVLCCVVVVVVVVFVQMHTTAAAAAAAIWKSTETEGEPQEIASTRTLCTLQCLVPSQSRVQRILDLAIQEIIIRLMLIYTRH